MQNIKAVVFNCIGTNHALGEQVLRDGLAAQVEIAQFIRTWDECYLNICDGENFAVKPGARMLLERLQSPALPCAVATSTTTPRAMKNLTASGLFSYFEHVGGGWNAGYSGAGFGGAVAVPACPAGSHAS